MSDLAHHLGAKYAPAPGSDAPGLRIFGVNSGGLFGDEPPGRLRRFAEQFDIPYPFLLDDVGYRTGLRGSGDESISPFPLQILIGPDGRIVYIKRQHDMDALEAAVRTALGLDPAVDGAP